MDCVSVQLHFVPWDFKPDLNAISIPLFAIENPKQDLNQKISIVFEAIGFWFKKSYTFWGFTIGLISFEAGMV